MSDLLTTLIQLQLGPMPMQTIVEWMNKQTSDAKTVLIGVAGVAILGLAVWRMVKSGFAVGALIMVGVVAALATWLIGGNGIETISEIIHDQAKAK